MENRPEVSVVTVCLNAIEGICTTMESVQAQTYPNIQHVVIDGGSNDGTVEAIAEYRSRISHFISEQDAGTYDAMNKGLRRCTGEFVIFMNAGDRFCSPDTISGVAPLLGDADVVYGDTLLTDSNGAELGLKSVLSTHELPDKAELRSLYLGQPFCHQSLFVRRSLCEPYDTSYRIGADYDWIIRIFKKKPEVLRYGSAIAAFQPGGLSSQFWARSLYERALIQTRHFGLFAMLGNHARILFRGIKAITKGQRLK